MALARIRRVLGAGRRLAKRQGRADQGGFEAVVAISIAAGIGAWIDGRYETSSYGLLIGLTVGSGCFVLELASLGRRLRELAEDGDA